MYRWRAEAEGLVSPDQTAQGHEFTDRSVLIDAEKRVIDEVIKNYQ